jgi:hypothetical protein
MPDRDDFGACRVDQSKTTCAMAAVGIFLFFGAIMGFLAGGTLLWRGTFLDRIWTLNATAYRELVPHGRIVGIFFLLLSAALTVTGAGWFKRRRWAWRLAIGIISAQVLGDLVNALMGDLLRGGIGIAIAGALLFYLLHPEVKAVFGGCRAPATLTNRSSKGRWLHR